ncbi:MAG: hypothetical protein HY812_15930 [Planctomycetes bacterium]|nr:hypothetical protein [Planctomycetota bacterium]
MAKAQRIKTAAAAAALAAFLLWAAGAALVREARILSSVSLAERRALLDVDLEDVYRASAREHYEMFTALRAHVPRDVHLVIYSRVSAEQQSDPLLGQDLKKQLTLLRGKLQALHFPAQVTPLAGEVENPETYLALLDPSYYVLNITPEADFPGQSRFDLVARGATYALHRFRGAD